MEVQQCEEFNCDKPGHIRTKLHNRALSNTFWYWACEEHFSTFIRADHLKIIKHRQAESINE